MDKDENEKKSSAAGKDPKIKVSKQKNTGKKNISETISKRLEFLTETGVFKKLSGIRIKLLLGFAFPVILMAVFGIISYLNSAAAIKHNFEAIASDALNAVKDNIFMGMDGVSGKSYALSDNDAIKNYYNNFDKLSTADRNTALELVENELANAKSSLSYIYSMHIIGEKGTSVSTVTDLPADIYDKFLESEEGKVIASSTDRYVWIGKHGVIDENTHNMQVNYAISLVRKMAENNGYIITDIPKKSVSDALGSLHLGDGSIIGFVTADGLEVLANTEETSVFSSLQFYKDAAAMNKDSGYSYERFNGKSYLFLYSKVGSTKAFVCALVPQSVIIQSVQPIKLLTIIFVAIACVVAGFVGTIIAGGIGSEIMRLMKSISQAAKGDLTTRFETKRKDEFLILTDSLRDMVAGMRSLIDKVITVGNTVNSSADTLSTTTGDILKSTKDISLAIDEIEQGVVQQAADTEQCLGRMSSLSDRITLVYDNTYEIEQIANETKDIVGEGITIIDELNSKSSATTDITHVVINEIEDLELQSRNIEEFVGVINDIAAQTNLLSLNASIEAARAGEAGRGFAVVAEEIRKLADQSMRASSQINNIVKTIKEKTKGTVASAKQAESIVGSQMDALVKTVNTFENINTHVGSLVNNLKNIAEGVRGIEGAKDDTLDAIRNISAVSQQTATSSEEVSATAVNQIASVEYLSKSATELAEDAKRLEEAIKIFTV